MRGRPTLVNNVETLAHLAMIARYGDIWFRSLGAPHAPGTMLVTVAGAVNRPGVYEIPLGMSVGQVMLVAGGPAEPMRAVLCGGYFGRWLSAEAAWRVPMTHADMRRAGGMMGAGILVALPDSACVLAETARVVRYMAEETAGQCGPCVFGLPALADAVAELVFTGGRGRATRQVRRLAGLVEGRERAGILTGSAALWRARSRSSRTTRSSTISTVPARGCGGGRCSRCPPMRTGMERADEPAIACQSDHVQSARDVRGALAGAHHPR